MSPSRIASWPSAPLRGVAGDVLPAALVVVAAVLDPVWERPGPDGWRWVVAVGLAAALVLGRRRAPVAATAGALALWLAVHTDHADDDPPFQFFVLLVMAYALGAHARVIPGAIALTAMSGVFVAMNVTRDLNVADSLVGPVAFAIAAGFAFALARGRRDRSHLERRAARLERERDERARLAVADERTRIARDLHDAVGHTVSVMVLQVGAVRTRLGAHQGEERAALLAAEGAGRDAVDEVRRMLGILRAPVDGDPLSAHASLAALDQMVEAVRAAGVTVEVRREGEQVQIPAGVDVTAYRIAQEALTNIVRHAPAASARLTVVHEPDAVVVEVTDDGGGRRATVGEPGHGIIGMRERVAVYGGTLEAAPAADEGFVVRARLPFGRGPAA